MPDAQPTGPLGLEAVRAWLAQNRHEAMRRFRAQGIGIGRSPECGCYAIVLYFKQAPPAGAIPSMLDGIPVRIEVTGPLKAQSCQQSR